MSDRAPAYEGWNTDSHRQTFDVWNRKAGWDFNFSYGCFTEQRYLRSQVLAMSNPRILDVGCATGTTYRYVSGLPGSPKLNTWELQPPRMLHPMRFEHAQWSVRGTFADGCAVGACSLVAARDSDLRYPSTVRSRTDWIVSISRSCIAR